MYTKVLKAWSKLFCDDDDVLHQTSNNTSWFRFAMNRTRNGRASDTRWKHCVTAGCLKEEIWHPARLLLERNPQENGSGYFMFTENVHEAPWNASRPNAFLSGWRRCPAKTAPSSPSDTVRLDDKDLRQKPLLILKKTTMQGDSW